MNIFQEFHEIVGRLHAEEIPYALIGGVAVAFHVEPRFTRDIDLLVHERDLLRVARALRQVGFRESTSPWALDDGSLILHRFLKVEGVDEMILDILTATDEHHMGIIDRALVAESQETGIARVANREDLIWLKRRRGSRQDQADIARLTDEES